LTAPCHLGGGNHEVGVWFEKKTNTCALMVKKLLAADGSALSKVRMAMVFTLRVAIPQQPPNLKERL